MSSMLQERLKLSFDLYSELVEHLNEASMSLKLAELPSNTIGDQLWCVVGARESYINGIKKGEWDGFQCSLSREEIGKKKSMTEAITKSAEIA